MDIVTRPSFRLDRIARHLVEDALSAQPVAKPFPPRVAVVVGVGPRDGLGAAIAARIAREGYSVFALGSTRTTLERTAADITAEGLGQVTPVVLESIGSSAVGEPVDIDNREVEQEIVDAFGQASAVGRLDLVVQNPGTNSMPPTVRDTQDVTGDMNMLVSSIVGREATRCMVPRKSDQCMLPCGTVVFIGATVALSGKPSFLSVANGKTGVRCLAQSMAKEYGPKGLHVAHLVVDGMLNVNHSSSSMLNLDSREEPWGAGVHSAAETVWRLSVEDPSAWTQEIITSC